jgi:hypothetical protein
VGFTKRTQLPRVSIRNAVCAKRTKSRRLRALMANVQNKANRPRLVGFTKRITYDDMDATPGDGNAYFRKNPTAPREHS